MSVKSTVYRHLDREPPQRQILLKVAAVLERVNGSFSADEIMDVLPVQKDKAQVVFNVRHLEEKGTFKRQEPVTDPKRYRFASPLMQAIAEPLMPLLIGGPASKIKSKDEMIGINHEGQPTLASVQEPLSVKTIEDAAQVFNFNEDGFINVKEFKATLSRHGDRPLSDKEVEQVFSILDKDHSGLISVDDLIAFLSGQHTESHEVAIEDYERRLDGPGSH